MRQIWWPSNSRLFIFDMLHFRSRNSRGNCILLVICCGSIFDWIFFCKTLYHISAKYQLNVKKIVCRVFCIQHCTNWYLNGRHPKKKENSFEYKANFTNRNSLIFNSTATGKRIGRRINRNSSNMVNSWLFGRVSWLGLCILRSSDINRMFHNHLVSHCVRRPSYTSTNINERERVHWKYAVRDNVHKGNSMVKPLGK